MVDSADWYRWEGNDLLLRLRVQPRAGRNAFAEPFGDALKVKLKAPPIDGRANAELVRFIAESFGVSYSAVDLVSGLQSRTKQLRVKNPGQLTLGISDARKGRKS
ncbi:DUF167 family protein [Lamprobacter modestohalophilus]|uniref:DUF167 domain-containing protein n=1 Tax=Lamprobacter modestohalophilus TaxID=1064514 RepID=UPI002ADEBBAD|nr:DUF167 family protein [Lamprobacter modestohalophilus]MEA1050922.1 DUF167 family protein [Lamprobacter modestohalophilus]